MSAINPNQEIDTLSIKQNLDGSYELNWDKEDPMWSWMNSLTSSEIQVIIERAIKEHLNDL